VALLAGAGVVLMAPGASAHAALRSSDPAAGAQLETAPDFVSLSFTEDPEPDLSEIQVLDTSGAVASTGPGEVSAADPGVMEVPLGPLEEGVYTVSWRVVSKVDGHTTAGAFAFGVGVSPEGLPSPSDRVHQTPPASVVEVAGRWVLFAGLGLVLGAAWIASLAFPEPPRPVLRMALAASVVAAIGLLALAEGQRSAADAAFGPFMGSTVGRAVLYRGIAVALMLSAVVLALIRRPPARTWLVMAAVAALAAILVHVAAGHANATGTFRPAKVATQWVHVGAVGIWLGGLATLLLGIRGVSGEPRVSAVRRFSSVALVAFLIVAATGTIRAINEIHSWDALFSTLYGAMVLVKVGLVLVLLSLAVVNRYRNVPRAGETVRGLRRTSRGELAVAALALTAAAIMASVSPRPQAAGAQAPPSVVASGTDFARTVRVRLTAQPGTAGVNRFTVRLTHPPSGDPVAADRVALRFSSLTAGDVASSVLELQPSDPGRYRASGSNLSLAGRWEITVTVQRGADSTEILLVAGTRCGARSLGGEPAIYSVDLPSGSMQGYVDPGAPGPNEVHVTWFDEAGAETDIGDDVAIVASRGLDSMDLEARRLGPGHFVAAADLEPGLWRFDVTGSGTDEQALSGCFQDSIGGSNG
jgi:copper transport protein